MRAIRSAGYSQQQQALAGRLDQIAIAASHQREKLRLRSRPLRHEEIDERRASMQHISRRSVVDA